ncbi:MAG: MFS transporter [Deltaproteobacteria bacterium]|nr:MFS transporter [Deltaproteobacteria bacterium]
MAEPSSPYRRWQIQIFAATWLGYVGYYFCRKAFYVVKKPLGDELGLDSVALAHIGSAYLIGYAVGQFSSAYFGRRLGPRLLLLAGMAISLLCNLGCGIGNGFWTVLVFMAINGMAQGTGWPGCIGSLGHWFRRTERGAVLGVWATCYQVGSVVATACAAFLLGHCGWRWSFFGATLVLLGIWAAVALLHPDTPESVGLAPIADGDPDPRPAGASAVAGRQRLGWSRDVVVAVLLMGGVYFCIKFLRYALWSWTPFFLGQNFGAAVDDAGYLSVIFDLCGFVGVLLAGYLSDKACGGRRALLSLLMLCGMAASFWLLHGVGGRSILAFAACSGLIGFMLYGPDSLLSGVGAIDVGTVRGALVAAGIINGMGSIGPIFEEQIVGWMYRRFEQRLEPIFYLLLAVAVTGVALMAVLYLRSRRGKANL